MKLNQVWRLQCVPFGRGCFEVFFDELLNVSVTLSFSLEVLCS